MEISIVAAVADNRIIGDQNTIPWRLKADKQHFRKITRGHCVIMGRLTLQSIGGPLPDRTNIVVSRKLEPTQGIIVARSLEEALEIAEKRGETEAMVIGGAQIYEGAMPRATKMYLTNVKATPFGDTFFPRFLKSEWSLVSAEPHSADDENQYAYEFCVYERRLT